MYNWKECIVHIPPCDNNLISWLLIGRLVDCNRSGCDQEGNIDWHIVTIRVLTPIQSNICFSDVVRTSCELRPFAKFSAWDFREVSLKYNII